ncbi:uncharacterized protein LOC124419747 isoform X2 [Lucilia cuprina]|nr:uncharacterized protein LOC124419747 isoform X2 [Lucilia cuprina]
MALPLLPANLIRSAFEEKNFETQWLDKVGCNNFSVCNEKTRATSAVEAYNGILGRFAEKNGHFFKFMESVFLPEKNVEHNHGHEEEIYKELKALNAIKQDCQNVAGALGGTKTNISTIRNAFRKACEGNQADTKNVIFSKLQRGLQKIISKNLITSPKNALQVIEAFNLENVWNDFGLSKDEMKPRHFFTAAIDGESYSFCLFSSLKSIDLIKENIPPTKRTYLIDATFKIVPHGCFKQLLIIYIEYFEEIFPIFFVLMSKKSKEAYKELLQYIQENIFDMDPSKCVTDYEQGLRAAINSVFPRSKLVGCWFHFCQAIRRSVTKQKPLLEFLRSSRNASLLYHKVLALPLLPPDLIKNSFKDIKSQIFLMDSNNIFLPFLKYFENQWINKVGCKNFSVYNENI